MPWACKFDKKAIKDLQKIPKARTKRIIQAIEVLAKDPYKPHNQIKALSGTLAGLFRLRIGNYRVVYFLNPEDKILFVKAVLLRNEKTYK
jgi:mRNA interferase RelE/StbE